jgi:AmmeMemoRadiSam system protein B
MKYFGTLVFSAVLFVGAYLVGVQNKVPVAGENKHVASYPQKDYYHGLEQPDYQQKFGEKVFGGIISHHLLTAEDMGKFFAEFTDQKIGTVVLIGPNHFSIGQPRVSISRQAYDTPWGIVTPNLEIIDALIAAKVGINEEEPFVYEHSIGAIVPFVAHYLPEAKLVPIVLRRETNPVELDVLVKELIRILPEDAIVIASVDFSHHLNRLGADFHDQASFSAIKSFDLERVFNLEIDSPPSIYTLLSYLDAKGAQKMSLVEKNSTDYTGNPDSKDVTSYFFAHFTKGLTEFESIATTLHFGDMMFDREVRTLLQKGGDPFAEIKGVEGNFLRGTDAVIANLEGPITSTTDCQEKEVVFQFPPETARLLGRYINVVNLANNHSQDCGESGLLDTKQVLDDDDDVAYLGEDLSPYTVRTGDLRIAIIGTNELGRRVEDFALEVAKIKELKAKYDQVVVHVHWGYEFATEPSVEQRQIAKMLVDAGADVIIGHHPHVIQPVERYKNSLIFYSLGNFIFDQTQPGTKEGIGVGLVHQKEGLGAYVFPYNIADLKPRLLGYGETKEFCASFLADLEVDVRDTCYVQIDSPRINNH